MSGVVIAGVIIALLFDFLNGMNDAANSIATVVSTRVLPPKLGVAWAAFFNLVGALGLGVSVAATVGKGIISPDIVTPVVVIGALVGASLWTWICTRFGLPISVSHALIGGLMGAGIVRAGVGCLIPAGIIKVSVFIILSPVIGLIISSFLMVGLMWMVRRWKKKTVDSVFRKLQLVSAAIYSVSHGSNDAQKTMGIIAVLLFSAGLLGETFYVPLWVILSCTLAIALGTLAGGWRVIKTMGMKMTKLTPFSGFAAETGGGITIVFASLLGIPVSTTHTIAGSIAGIGIVSNIGAVRWGVVTHIVWAWILTIPVSALSGALVYYILYLTGI